MAVALLLFFLPLAQARAQQLQCQPCSHGYGQVPIASSKQYFFKLTNVGTQSLRIRYKSKTGAAFSFGHFPLPVTLRPGASTKLPVIFTPIAIGKTTGTITLISKALNPKLVMIVSGTGIPADAARLGVAPSALDFGSVTVGSNASLQATLSASNGPVTISSVQLTSAEFSLPGFVLPLTIAAGQSVPATVLFTPNASGTASAKLVLYSDAYDSPKGESLTGVGVAVGAHYTDLSWDPSPAPVVGYNVYRGGKSGGPYTQINAVLDASTNYTDDAVNAGATYYYVVNAVDNQGQESPYSNEAKVVIPNP